MQRVPQRELKRREGMCELQNYVKVYKNSLYNYY